jgi:hypothetical protein
MGSFLVYRETVGEKVKVESDTSSVNSDYKSDGLIKKTFRIDGTSGKKRHLVSYYLNSDVDNGRLKLPLEFPQLRDIVLSSDVYPDYAVEFNRPQPPNFQAQPQQDERAAAFYYQQQAQQRNSSLNSSRAAWYDDPRRDRSRSNPHQLYGKRKGGPDEGFAPVVEMLRSAASQYFTHAPGASTNVSSVDSSRETSREGTPHSSPDTSRVQRKFEYASIPNRDKAFALISPQSQSSGSPVGSKAGSGGLYSAESGYPPSRNEVQMSNYQTTLTSAIDSSSVTYSPQKPRPETPVFSSSLKNELVPLRSSIGEPEAWRKMLSGQQAMMTPDVKRMSYVVKRRVSLLAPLIVTGNPSERTSISTVGPDSVVASPSLSPSKGYKPDEETSRISIPNISAGEGPLFLAHSFYTLANERVFLSNEKL